MQSQIASRGEICPIQELNESLRVNLFFPCCWGFLGPASRCSPAPSCRLGLLGDRHLPFPGPAPLAAAVDVSWPAGRRSPGPHHPVTEASLWQKMKTSWPCCNPSGTRNIKKYVKTERAAACPCQFAIARCPVPWRSRPPSWWCRWSWQEASFGPRSKNQRWTGGMCGYAGGDGSGSSISSEENTQSAWITYKRYMCLIETFHF